MLIHLGSMPGHEDYRKVLKGRRVLFLIAVLMGAAAIGISVAAMLGNPDANDFAMGFITGSGIAIAGIGLFGLWSIRRTLRDEKRFRADFIKETDERTQEISRRASSLTMLVSVFLFYGALLVSVLLDRTVFQTLLAVLGVYVAVFLGSTLYYGKKL